MTVFHLPDLGEGLPDAEIHEWFVKVGDEVSVDQPLVSMETAKAVVDVPCPSHGIIKALHGEPGDIIKTGAPLVTYQSEIQSEDQGTVVGHLQASDEQTADDFIIGSSQTNQRKKATPGARLKAKKLNINIHAIQGTGEDQIITIEDVNEYVRVQSIVPEGYEPLKGVRRAMLASMSESHQIVVPVSIFDEVDVTNWIGQDDITVRLIQAICHACKVEPALNAWFNTEHAARKFHDTVHLGLAMDNEEGLFVPVIHDAQNQTPDSLRAQINAYKVSVQNRSVEPDQLKGATITLSNFGKFSGRFASPIIVPPMVAILAVGKIYEGVKSVSGEIQSCKLIPLSLSFDHRAVTGGEATRFLGTIMEALG